MPQRDKLAGALLLLAATATAAAGERFYPIVGADGRMQMIRGEAPAAAPKEAPAATVAPSAAGAARDLPAGAVEETADPASTAGAEAARPDSSRGAGALPHAAYDSDEYVDSEAMDAATTPAAGNRKRFYLVKDGMGDIISESTEASAVDVVAKPQPVPGEAGTNWEPLELAGAAWPSQEALGRMPWLPDCLPARQRELWPSLVVGESREVVVDRPDLRLIGKDRVHSGWRLDGNGPRTLLVQSFASSQRQPAFLVPRIAFLDARGCVTRVVQGWFDRRYAANDRRHAYVRGELLVHTGEEAAVLLLPPEQDTLAAAWPLQASRQGQLKFTLKK